MDCGHLGRVGYLLTVEAIPPFPDTGIDLCGGLLCQRGVDRWATGEEVAKYLFRAVRERRGGGVRWGDFRVWARLVLRRVRRLSPGNGGDALTPSSTVLDMSNVALLPGKAHAAVNTVVCCYRGIVAFGMSELRIGSVE